jgi:hypothetical protein
MVLRCSIWRAEYSVDEVALAYRNLTWKSTSIVEKKKAFVKMQTGCAALKIYPESRWERERELERVGVCLTPLKGGAP